MACECSEDFKSAWFRLNKASWRFSHHSQTPFEHSKRFLKLSDRMSDVLFVAVSTKQLDQLLFFDIFRIFNDLLTRKVGKSKNHRELLMKIFEWIQVFVSNSSASFLEMVFTQQSFLTLLKTVSFSLFHDEIADHWVNLCKTITLKLTPNSNISLFSFLYEKLIHLEENNKLLEATRKSTILLLVKLKSDSRSLFLSQSFFLSIISELPAQLAKIARKIDEQSFHSNSSALQNSIFDFQESLLYVEEVISSIKSTELKNFALNFLIYGFLVPSVLPVLRPKASFSEPKLGMNCAIFILTQIFEFGRQHLLPILLNNFILQDLEISNELRVENMSQIVKDSERKSDEKIEIPEVFFHEIKVAEVGENSKSSQVIRSLILFLKSKDDNLLLNTSQLLHHIIDSSSDYMEREEIGKICEILAENLSHETQLKQITIQSLLDLVLSVYHRFNVRNADFVRKFLEKEEDLIRSLMLNFSGKNFWKWAFGFVDHSNMKKSDIRKRLSEFPSYMLFNTQFLSEKNSSDQLIPVDFQPHLRQEDSLREICWEFFAFGELLSRLSEPFGVEFEKMKETLQELVQQRNKRLPLVGDKITMKIGKEEEGVKLMTLPFFNLKDSKMKMIVGSGFNIYVLEASSLRNEFTVLYSGCICDFKFNCRPYTKRQIEIGEKNLRLRFEFETLRDTKNAEVELARAIVHFEETKKKEIFSSIENLIQ